MLAVGVAAYASRAARVFLLITEVVVRVGLSLLDLPGVALHRPGVALHRRVANDAQHERRDHVNRREDSEIEPHAMQLGVRRRRNVR